LVEWLRTEWLNQVELWFSKIDRDVIARGVFTSVSDLKRKLLRYIRHYNKSPRTVKWKYADPSRHLSTQSVGTGHSYRCNPTLGLMDNFACRSLVSAESAFMFVRTASLRLTPSSFATTSARVMTNFLTYKRQVRLHYPV
jgi:hypothetical protein